jgi:hypothetical protein
MKLPAIAVAMFFALGIAVGLVPSAVDHANSTVFIGVLFSAAVVFLAAGFLLAMSDKLLAASAASSVCWILLGVMGVCLEQQPRAANHILVLSSTGKINLKSPLRYFGQLRDEPEYLPSGIRYDLDLSGVQSEGTLLSVTGGLRLSYATRSDQPAPIGLHAGDSIAFLTQAKLPQMYRDEGAFDRRAYLSQQGIDLIGALRAPELLELFTPARPSISGWISRQRRRLREEINSLWAADPDSAGCERCCWAIAIPLIVPKRSIFKKLVRFIFWYLLACTSGRSQ